MQKQKADIQCEDWQSVLTTIITRKKSMDGSTSGSKIGGPSGSSRTGIDPLGSKKVEGGKKGEENT